MIYTVTLNPAIDYYMDFETIKMGMVNRSNSERIAFGGKGINVSRMLARLGFNSCAVAIVGGYTGSSLLAGLKEEGLKVKPVFTEDNTRINVKLKDGTELNGNGPIVDGSVVEKLKKILFNSKSGDIVVFSGSICKGVPSDIYADLIEELKNRNVLTVVDTSGDALKKSVGKKPFLIKPNLHELSIFFNTEIRTKETAAEYALKLTNEGVGNVLVSMGENGAILASDNHLYFCPAPKTAAVNTVGAGDCTLAAFIYAYLNGMSKYNSLAYAVACGSARVSSEFFPTLETVNEVYHEITEI